MDLSIPATTAYLPTQGIGQQADARGSSGATAQGYVAAAENKDQASTKDQAPANQARLSPEETQKAREAAARRKEPGAEVARVHGFAFEYEGNRQVMKVNNEKGILIYQVPSKGHLALIEAEENTRKRSQQLSLTA